MFRFFTCKGQPQNDPEHRGDKTDGKGKEKLDAVGQDSVTPGGSAKTAADDERQKTEKGGDSAV